MLKESWNKLPANFRRWAFVGLIFGLIAILILALSPEPRKRNRGATQNFEHLLTDEDTSKVTLQNLAAKIDNLRSDYGKLQRQYDTVNSELRRAGQDKGPGRQVQKELADLRGRMKELDRKASLTNKRIEGIEDQGYQISTEAIERAIQEGVATANDPAFKGNTSGSNGGFPVAAAMPVVPETSPANPADASRQKPDPKTDLEGSQPPEEPKDKPGEVGLKLHKSAGDYFKNAEVPDKRSIPNRTGAGFAPLGIGGAGEAVKGKALVGRSISSGDARSSVIEAKANEVKRSREREGEKDKKEAGIYIPAGSIIEAVIIAGMDAPTGKESRSNPFPALMRFKKEAILPNRHSADIRECFLIASGYGDLSSSRAYLRGESVSCVREDGGVVETRMDAWATGEDGKAGIRGRLVSKEGQIIAKALQAGFMEGVSKAFDVKVVPTVSTGSDSSDTVQFQNVLSNEAIQGGLMGGAKTAAGRIAEYWIEMAEQVKPVIEVDAGRTVSFIVNRGVKLQLKGG